MSKHKKGKLRRYARVKGEGNDCPRCHKPMQRRERIMPPRNKNYYYKEWDYCLECGYLQHYEEFKSNEWKEAEEQQSFFDSL